jgi:polyhydroxyalkanoate synthesis regulator phasin
MFDLGEGLKKVFLAGVGAVALTAEKSKQIADQLVAKGELTVEQGKVLNEELKRKATDRLNEMIKVTVVTQTTDADGGVTAESSRDVPASEAVEEVIRKIDAFTPEEIQKLREKLFPDGARPQDGSASGDQDGGCYCGEPEA